MLVVVDIQRDYFEGGAFPLVGSEEAASRAAELLAGFRAAGEPVIHIQHVWDAPDATFFRPGTPGIEIHPLAAPVGDEPVLQKESPNSFLGTGLEGRLRALEAEAAAAASGGLDLVVIGMMTSMCVDATVRAASDLGFTVTVGADACAAPDLEFGGQAVPGALVHAAFLAALSDSYATVVPVAELLTPA